MKINEIIIPTSLWQQHKDCIPRELTTCQDRQSSGFLLYFGSRKVPVPPPRHTSADQRGEGGSPGVPPQQQASSTPPHPAGCWRVHLYHSIQNFGSPLSPGVHTLVHECTSALVGEAMHVHPPLYKTILLEICKKTVPTFINLEGVS